MHRVSALLSWDRRKSTPKPIHLNPPSAAAATTGPDSKVNKESFWPSTLDQECDKAARILKSFCTDGCLTPPEPEVGAPASTADEPETPVNLIKRIPKRIVQNAAGIAIFTCMRSGLWMTGSGGSGILIARKADGTWSPPSALLLHTPTLSFVMGIDVYDCVLVINNLSALESIAQPQVTLGEDVGLSCGPMVPLGSGEEHIRWKDLGNTVLTYLKARGQIQPVNLHGCMLTERGNENERFYGGDATMMTILAGDVCKNVDETRPLFEVIKQAEGRTDFDVNITDQVSAQCAPGDALIETPRSSPPESPSKLIAFGVPDDEDPDPFGVLALEMAGLEIREAGTQRRPTSSQLDFAPSPTSPLFPRFKRQSMDTVATRSNRCSSLSVRTEQTHPTDAYTQTDASTTPHTTPSLSQSEDGRDRQSLDKAKSLEDVAEEEVDYTKIDFSPIRLLSNPSLDGVTAVDSLTTTDDDRTTERDVYASSDEALSVSSPPWALTAPTSPEATPVLKAEDEDEDEGDDADDEDDMDDDDDEPVVVFEVASAVNPVRAAVARSAQAVHVKGAIVTIAKRVPPPLPLRNPARSSRMSRSEFGDGSALDTPSRYSFASAAPDTPARDSFSSGARDDAQGGECDTQTPVQAQPDAPLSLRTPVKTVVDDGEVATADDTAGQLADDAPAKDPEEGAARADLVVPEDEPKVDWAAVRNAPDLMVSVAA